MAKPNLKDDLRDTAHKLFEEKGIQRVSLRDVAAAAGVSVGNLTYYYPKKEDLLLAILEKGKETFWPILSSIPDEPKEVLHFLVKAAMTLQLALAHSFVHRELTSLCTKYKSIREAMAEGRENFYHILLEAFDKLRRAGLFREDIPIRNYSNLAYTIIVCTSRWREQAEIFRYDTLPHPKISESIIMLIQPYLTEEGIRNLKNISDICTPET